MSVKKLGISPNGIETYELQNGKGVRVQVVTYGARLTKILLPTAKGVIDVLAGFDDADGYLGENPYFNAVIGRVANRIGGARFTLNGKTYRLNKNDGENCLHGGAVGFDRKIFSCEISGESAVKMTYVSPDGEENFPGNLTLSVTYVLTEENGVSLRYEAFCDEDTVFSPTNHAYFSLDGDFSSVRDTEVFIDSTLMTEVDGNLIPTGNITDVSGTGFDFSERKKIGDGIDETNELFKIARNGYDFNYILRKDRDISSPAATAYSSKSGIKMTVYTDRPCMQLYTGNFLDGTIVGKTAFRYQSAFCMETQGYPNACNVPSFPSMTLKKGEKFFSETTYRFEW